MGILVVKIIRSLLVSFKEDADHPQIKSQGDLVGYLESKHDFLNSVVLNFVDYMERMKSTYMSDPKYLDHPETQIMVDKIPHGD